MCLVRLGPTWLNVSFLFDISNKIPANSDSFSVPWARNSLLLLADEVKPNLEDFQKMVIDENNEISKLNSRESRLVFFN